MVIEAPILWNVDRAEKWRGILGRPEYAHNDDGLDALMTDGTLYYDIKGRNFVDEAYLPKNFRQAEIRPRDLRMGRVASREAPSGQTTLQEYHMSYRSYLIRRHKNSRDGAISTGEMYQSESSSSSQNYAHTEKAEDS